MPTAAELGADQRPGWHAAMEPTAGRQVCIATRADGFLARPSAMASTPSGGSRSGWIRAAREVGLGKTLLGEVPTGCAWPDAVRPARRCAGQDTGCSGDCLPHLAAGRGAWLAQSFGDWIAVVPR